MTGRVDSQYRNPVLAVANDLQSGITALVNNLEHRVVLMVLVPHWRNRSYRVGMHFDHGLVEPFVSYYYVDVKLPSH